MAKLGKALLWGGGLGVLGLLWASSAKADQGPVTRDPIAEPLDRRTPEQIRTALCWAIPRSLPDGTFDPTDLAALSLVARNASVELWGVDVRGTVEGDDPTVGQRARELEAEIDRLVRDTMAGQGVCGPEAPAPEAPAPEAPEAPAPEAPAPEPRTFGSVEDRPATFGSVEPPRVELDPVWVAPDMGQLTAAYPEGGRFYQVGRGDVLLGTNASRAIVYRWIASEAFKAAKAAGQSDDDARATARRLARRADLRMAAYNLLGCVPFNDANYATYLVTEKSFPLFPTGRAFTLLPHHARNRARLERGDAALRNIDLGNPSDTGSGVAAALWDDEPTGFELLWLPPLDGSQLLSGVVATDPRPWPNAPGAQLSRIHPPPNIQALGQLLDGQVERRVWGCAPNQLVYGAA